MGAVIQPGDDYVEISETPIGAAPLLAAVAHPRSGATCLVLGTVREYSPGREGVTHLEYEAYSEYTGKSWAESRPEITQWEIERYLVRC